MAELNPDVTGDTPAGSLRITTQRLDYDGQWVKQVKVRQSTTVVGAITPQESVTAGVWTAYHDEPISDILVYQVTETRTVPGLYVPFTRYDLQLGPIVGTRRLVENSGLTTTLTAVYKRTYEAHPNSKAVCWELIETNSDGTGSTDNPAYPIRVSNEFEAERGDVETTSQISTDITTDSSLVIGTRVASGPVAVTPGVPLASLALNAAGTLYKVGEVITLAGGTFSPAATVTIATTTMVEVITTAAAGTGMTPGTVLTINGGTFTTAATLTVTTTKVVSATVQANGTAPDGTYTVTGTTGTASTLFQASVTYSAGGTVVVVNSITTAGSYTANPTNIAAEPVTGTPTGLVLAVVMGVLGREVLNGGSYTVTPSIATPMTASGGNDDSAFRVGHGVLTFTLTSGGTYTVGPVSLTQGSVDTGFGTGATFTNAQYTVTAAIETEWEPINQYLRDKKVSKWAIPGPTLRNGERYDKELGLVTSTKQLVDGTSNPAQSESETGLTKYDTSPYGNPVLWKMVESWVTANFPTVQENLYDRERGAIKRTAILTTDLTTAGSLAAATSLVTEIRYEPRNAYLRKLITETWTVPGPILTGLPKIDDDGVEITTTRNLDLDANIATGELVSGGTWSITTTDPYSGNTGGEIRWKNVQSRPLAADATCPIIREDRWNDHYNTVMATFWQYVPDGTTKKAIGAAYSTADSYVTDSITALTVSDPGSGYTTIPTFTISASPGGGTQATVSATPGATTLTAVSAAVSAPGAAVSLGTTFTVSGGTSTTAAVVTVTGGALSTLALNAPGTGQAVGDVIGLQGGVYSRQGAITWTAVQAVVAPTVVVAGTAMTVGTVLTLAGGTGTNPTATVTHTKVNATGATVAAGGSGYTDGTQTVTGTTGTGTKFQASVTVAGTAITAILSITVAGDYTANPANIASEPVTITGAAGDGLARLSVIMGALTVSLTTGGTLTAVASSYTSSGGGGDATFTISSYGGKTFTISNPGEYSAPETATFTQASTSGTGTGATFQTATYVPSVLTVTTGGAYTVIPTSPASFTAGSMTAILDFGVGAVALGTAGTKYYYPPTITPSYGTALILPTMSDPILLPGTNSGYVVDTGLLNTEHSLIKRLVWSTMYVPPSRVERATKQFPLPNVFTWISNWDLHPPSTLTRKGPFYGENFTNVDNGVSVSPARCLISYSRGPSGNIPKTWQVITPGVFSQIFRINANTIHNSWTAVETDGTTTQNIEIMPASTPASYVRGQALIVEVSEKKVIGPFYERRIYTIN